MRYEPIDSRLFRGNRERLLAQLPPDSIAVVHSNDVQPLCADGERPFYQSSDFFYLTGIDQEESVLILDPGAPRAEDRAWLFLRETSDKIRVWEGSKLTRKEGREQSGIARVSWTSRFEPALRQIMRTRKRVYLNANEHPRLVSPAPSREDRFREELQHWYPSRRYERLAPLLCALREVKSVPERELIQRATDITATGFERVLRFVKPGVAEYEVEAEMAHEYLRHGSRGFAYNPIVASGGSACALHYVTNDDTCDEGELLLIDAAAEYARYNSDLTRTIPVNGRFTPRQRAVYESVLRVFQVCISDLLRPGIDLKVDYRPAVGRIMEEELLSLGLLDPAEVDAERAKDGTDDEVDEEKRLYRKYYMHGTSHSLGLDVHDVQGKDRKVKAGMIYTVEPGIYIPDENIGVRLENVILVGENGNEDFMANIPIEPDEIEERMAAGS